ncbi:MAG: endopeptidase La [candidate division Zixibacteria bacterium]|nr:endopeptidase La [candidate division Zixibacteria bacterium]
MAMIIKPKKKPPFLSIDSETVIPVLPIRSAIIFPGETHTIQVGRSENLELLDSVLGGNKRLVLSFSPQRFPSGKSVRLSQISVLAKVQSAKRAMAESRMVTLEGIRRVALTGIKTGMPFLQASIAELDEEFQPYESMERHTSEILDLISHLTRLDSRYAGELLYTLGMNQSSPTLFADRIGAMVHFQLTDKQAILEEVRIEDRHETILRLLKVEIDNISTLAQINDRVNESLEKKKRESFLRQQLMEIHRELGEEFIEEDISKLYMNRLKDIKGIPSEVANRLKNESDRLKHLSSSSAEYGSTKTYLDLLLSLPWKKELATRIDLNHVSEVLNTDYYGLMKIKEQVLEYLAVKQLSKDNLDIPILCFAGPVGTGKASLAKAVASSLGKKFVRINGTSIIELEDIKGTYRNEIGAGPGELVRSIKRENSFDLVVYLEDLEYVIESEDSNALLALLEAVDPRQNSHFIDTFVGVPIDLSRILFVLSLSNSEDFPEPFAHRLEVVEMSGYIDTEKIIITKKYILPKLYKRYGITRSELKFSDDVLGNIIRYYTMEAGLVGLRQQVQKIFRRVTRKKATGEPCKIALTASTLENFLGTPLFIPEKAMTEPEIGVANGLAWTGAGGDLMLIEGLKMRGTGQVATTGLLGDVMKESIQAAHSFVRARAETLGIDHDDFVNYDIHIHFPMGSIPKDGPSAGVTVTIVLASVLAERPVRSDIAMTGEVTLRGKVIAVGGVKEKISAAYRAGIRTVILPKENEKDIKSIPREITRKTTFIFIDSVDELFEQALLDFQPSTFTLEKLFAEEIEKAKKRGRSRSKSKAAKSKKTVSKVKKKTTTKKPKKKKTTIKKTIKKKTT